MLRHRFFFAYRNSVSSLQTLPPPYGEADQNRLFDLEKRRLLAVLDKKLKKAVHRKKSFKSLWKRVLTMKKFVMKAIS